MTSYPSFNKVASHGPVTKYQKTVQTPVPNGRTEENHITLYDIEDGHSLKVAKISSKGWSIRDISDAMSEYHSNKYFDDENTALERAQTFVEEVLSDD